LALQKIMKSFIGGTDGGTKEQLTIESTKNKGD
jgi:hypothetical protein